ncbi:MAG: glycosyltransferase family 2 protein [Phycisphaerales bacterium]
MRVSFIIPTRNRHEVLEETLGRIGSTVPGSMSGSCELIIVDNGSSVAVEAPRQLANVMPVRVIRLGINKNTAARNIAAIEAEGEWLVMLDDDSSPLAETDWGVLDQQDEEVAAIGGEITLPDGRHESGGLPEVVVGCGCAIRRDVFLELAGYDASFGYYAEEYDLCAGLIQSGYRVAHSRSLRFLHRKSSVGRDFNRIIRYLVRNNGWVLQRYAPEQRLGPAMDGVLERYRQIAIKERVLEGYELGVTELEQTLSEQVRTPLSAEQWDRFIGRAAVGQTLRSKLPARSSRVEILGSEHEKGRAIVADEIGKLGCQIVHQDGDVRVIGSISPGPMLDLMRVYPDAIAPWGFEEKHAVDH